MYKVLIVEDDNGISDGIAGLLSGWGMQPEKVTDFRNVMSEFARINPHLVLLDISLPFMDGYYWCREIRTVSKLPIIFVSSASDNMNIVMAMNMGADDFIAKPFDGNVLVAKVQALLRRTYDFGQSVSVLEHKGALLNTEEQTFVYNGEKISLTKNDFRILLVLMKNKGKVISREKLMEELWQTDDYVD